MGALRLMGEIGALRLMGVDGGASLDGNFPFIPFVPFVLFSHSPYIPYLPYPPYLPYCSHSQDIPKRTNLLLEGVRFGTKSKLTRKGVYWAYIPFRGNELGAEDDPLSQQI